MHLKITDFPQIVSAPVDQKIEFIDEIWEDVRRTRQQQDVHPEHLATLDQRLKAVQQDPNLALSPSAARALLRK
jgi:hypothetical protein